MALVARKIKFTSDRMLFNFVTPWIEFLDVVSKKCRRYKAFFWEPIFSLVQEVVFINNHYFVSKRCLV